MKFTIRQKRASRVMKVKNALSIALSECMIETPLLITALQDNWSKIVNVIIASHSKPERIFKNVLYIAADHPAYSNELILMKNVIMERLNRDYGFNDIKDVRVEIKRLKW